MTPQDPSWAERTLDLVVVTAITSGTYLLCFFATFWVAYPLQSYIIPPSESAASLLFLPHGVRILAAWLLGWRAVVALAPGALIAHIILRGDAALDLNLLLGMLIGITVAPAVFQVLKWMRWDLSPDPERLPSWIGVMTAGLITSVANSILTNLAFDSELVDYFAYLVGDFFGLFFLMLTMMFAMRATAR